MMIDHVEAEDAYGMSLASLTAERPYSPSVAAATNCEAQLAVVEASTGESEYDRASQIIRAHHAARF